MTGPSSPIDTSQTAHAKGSGALAFLRSKIDQSTLSIIPEILNISQHDERKHALIRIRLAELKYEGKPGHLCVYMTPQDGAHKLSDIHFRAELKLHDSEEITKVPVTSDYSGPFRHMPMHPVFCLKGAETRKELEGFVSHVFLVAAHNGECDQLVPINERLTQNLTALCLRPKFRARIRQTQDGSGPDGPVTEKGTKSSKRPREMARNSNATAKLAPANMRSSLAQRDDGGGLRMLDRSGGS